VIDSTKEYIRYRNRCNYPGQVGQQHSGHRIPAVLDSYSAEINSDEPLLTNPPCIPVFFRGAGRFLYISVRTEIIFATSFSTLHFPQPASQSSCH